MLNQTKPYSLKHYHVVLLKLLVFLVNGQPWGASGWHALRVEPGGPVYAGLTHMGAQKINPWFDLQALPGLLLGAHKGISPHTP